MNLAGSDLQKPALIPHCPSGSLQSYRLQPGGGLGNLFTEIVVVVVVVVVVVLVVVIEAIVVGNSSMQACTSMNQSIPKL